MTHKENIGSGFPLQANSTKVGNFFGDPQQADSDDEGMTQHTTPDDTPDTPEPFRLFLADDNLAYPSTRWPDHDPTPVPVPDAGVRIRLPIPYAEPWADTWTVLAAFAGGGICGAILVFAAFAWAYL